MSDMQSGGNDTSCASLPKNDKKAEKEAKKQQRAIKKEEKRAIHKQNSAKRKEQREEDFKNILNSLNEWYRFLSNSVTPFYKSLGLLLLFLFPFVLMAGYTWCFIAYLKGKAIAEKIFVGVQIVASLASIGIGYWGISLAKESAREFSVFKQDMMNFNFPKPASNPVGECKSDEK